MLRRKKDIGVEILLLDQLQQMGLEQTRVQSAKLLLCQTHAFKTPVQDPSFWFHFRHDI